MPDFQSFLNFVSTYGHTTRWDFLMPCGMMEEASTMSEIRRNTELR